AGSGAAGLGWAGAGLDSNSVGASASADFAGFLVAREAVLRTRLTAVSPASGVWSDKWEFLARCERPEAGGMLRGVVQTGCGAQFNAGCGQTNTRRQTSASGRAGPRSCAPAGDASAITRRLIHGRSRMGRRLPGQRPRVGTLARPRGRQWADADRADPHCSAQSALSISCASCGLPTAPIWVPWTWPSLNSSSIGIERTWYFRAVARFSSTLTLAIFTFPAYSPASSSRAGAIILHGPHQGAQKSTSTGSADCSTVALKSASVAWMTCSLTERLLGQGGGPARRP